MRTKVITAKDVIKSVSPGFESRGELENLKDDVKSLKVLLTAILATISSSKLLEMYVMLNGSDQFYDWDEYSECKFIAKDSD